MRQPLANILRAIADWLDPPVYERLPGLCLEEGELVMRGPLHSVVELPEYGTTGPVGLGVYL